MKLQLPHNTIHLLDSMEEIQNTDTIMVIL